MAMTRSTVSLEGMQRDRDLWFDDGNGIVIAQQIVFCFHRGALARHSKIFRGYFSVPQPATSTASLNRTMDGCPTIRITDSSYDFKNLLRAVYDGASIFTAVEPMEFGVLASLVRMGHKYQVNTILHEALGRLKTVFTPDISTWDDHQGTSNAIVNLRPEDAIEAINLFQLTGRTEMLVTAFYMCGLLDVKTLVEGVARADGAIERLNGRDLQRCLTAQMVLLKHDARLKATVFRLDAPKNCKCKSREERRATLESEFEDILSAFPEVLNSLPIHHTFLTNTIDHLYSMDGLCNACVTAFKAHHTALRRDLWERLPGIFGLPD